MRPLLRCVVLSIIPAIGFAQPSAPVDGAPVSQPAADTPSQVVSPSNRDALWRPTDADMRKVIEQTNAYFSAKDEHRFADAYASFSESQRQLVAFDGWRAQLEVFYGKAGVAEARTIRKVTWYKDPANAKPGIYAAADFSSQFSNLALHCGYVAWHQRADGSFEVVREEENSIDKTTAAKLTPQTMQNVRAQFRC